MTEFSWSTPELLAWDLATSSEARLLEIAEWAKRQPPPQVFSTDWLRSLFGRSANEAIARDAEETLLRRARASSRRVILRPNDPAFGASGFSSFLDLATVLANEASEQPEVIVDHARNAYEMTGFSESEGITVKLSDQFSPDELRDLLIATLLADYPSARLEVLRGMTWAQLFDLVSDQEVN